MSKEVLDTSLKGNARSCGCLIAVVAIVFLIIFIMMMFAVHGA